MSERRVGAKRPRGFESVPACQNSPFKSASFASSSMSPKSSSSARVSMTRRARGQLAVRVGHTVLTGVGQQMATGVARDLDERVTEPARDLEDGHTRQEQVGREGVPQVMEGGERRAGV
jgi:hypothetical protein